MDKDTFGPVCEAGSRKGRHCMRWPLFFRHSTIKVKCKSISDWFTFYSNPYNAAIIGNPNSKCIQFQFDYESDHMIITGY